jgi:hypothetical protein
MSSKKTPKRQVPVDEVVHEFPETPVEPWTPTPVEPINVIPMPKPERAELPLSLATTIAEVMAQLAPGDVRDKLNANLMAGVQSYITAIKVEVAANSAREIAEIRDGLVRGAREQIDAKIAEITKASGPTNPQDMQKLVSQEYLNFPLSIVTVKPVPNEEPIEATVHFTIREMPQAQEKKLLEILTLRIPPMMKKFQGLKFTTGSSNMEKLREAISVAPEIVDLIAGMTALCLDPYSTRPEIDQHWVQEHLATSRQMAILEAQFMASRIRDFFYAVSRVIPRT